MVGFPFRPLQVVHFHLNHYSHLAGDLKTIGQPSWTVTKEVPEAQFLERAEARLRDSHVDWKNGGTKAPGSAELIHEPLAVQPS